MNPVANYRLAATRSRPGRPPHDGPGTPRATCGAPLRAERA
ncbi:hypothetical protein OH687_34000 [Burkholderia anthina]|nr:hypothetical protein OH687_34000 [Burkholderia anthina]